MSEQEKIPTVKGVKPNRNQWLKEEMATLKTEQLVAMKAQLVKEGRTGLQYSVIEQELGRRNEVGDALVEKAAPPQVQDDEEPVRRFGGDEETPADDEAAEEN